MSEIVKHLAARLHRHYGSVVRRPMPWRMIDVLVSLEERLEERARRRKSGHLRDGENEGDSVSQRNEINPAPPRRHD